MVIYRDDAHDLPQLTPKQMAFVRGVARGLSIVDAWCAAYTTTGTRRTHYCNASRLKAHPKIRAWLDHIATDRAASAACDYERHMVALYDLREAAKAERRYTAALAAEKARGRAAGLYR